jgi:TonB family protein
MRASHGRLAHAAGIVTILFVAAVSPRAAALGPVAAPPAEPPILTGGVEGDYLRAVHDRIHARWAPVGASWSSSSSLGPPAGAPAREAEVFFSVRWDGTLAELSLVRSSGDRVFDGAALGAVRQTGKLPVPPIDLHSDDGLTHLRWTLAGKGRLCSDGEVQRREAPLAQSLPFLLAAGRVEEAFLRATRTASGGDAEEGLALFARTWLARPGVEPGADAAAAIALARLGDKRQVERLRAALRRRETAVAAAEALRGLGVDVCHEIAADLAGTDVAARERALRVLRAGVLPRATPGAAPSTCVAAAGGIVTDARAERGLRLLALDTVLAVAPEAARPLLVAASQDPDPALRGRATLLAARPHGGRPALYRYIALLQDPAVEVRAAAAAAMIRSCGEMALDQLVFVLKEKDPRVAIAVAGELGAMSSPAAMALLARLARRPDGDVQAAVVRALAARTDGPAHALLASLPVASRGDRAAAAAARAAALAAATPEQAAALTKDDPQPALPVYEALLRAQRRQDAAAWIIGAFGQLQPRERAEALGEWLASRPDPSLSAR